MPETDPPIEPKIDPPIEPKIDPQVDPVDPPSPSFDLYAAILEHAAHIEEEWKRQKHEGHLTVQGVVAVVMHTAQCGADLVREIPGGLMLDEQKQVVLAAVGRLCREKIEPLDIPGVPEALERRVIDPLLGDVLHAVASAAFDLAIVVRGLAGAPSPAPTPAASATPKAKGKVAA